jgi:hypothetical protein
MESLLKYFKAHPTRIYLLLVNVAMVIFLIVFQNVGLLPLRHLGDFTFFIILGILLAIYRPGWCFVFFIGSLALENINLAPMGFPLMIRPYQLLGLLTLVGFFFQYFSGRLPFALPKPHWVDGFVLLFASSGFLSVVFSAQRGVSFKQSLVALSFGLLYALVRIYIQSFEDLKRIIPFFLSGGLVISLYSIWQNIRFAEGLNSFEVMPGRPNGTFTEPDWYGIFLVLILAILLGNIYQCSKKDNREMRIVYCLLVILTTVSLILTVSRSSWLGAIIVIIVFLKASLLDGSLSYSKLSWKKFFTALEFLAIAGISSVAIVYVFHLTTFQLSNRAQSAGGLQQITVACNPGHPALPDKINSLDDLALLGCRHINLEDIGKEKSLGNDVLVTYRPDPNVGIRARIYSVSLAQIKKHPLFGIGWGNISSILGSDERGAGLNASNIFLETWLGAGIIGLLSLLFIFGYILVRAVAFYLGADRQKQFISIALLLAWTAILIPNLFNSGIFLGFVWVYFGVAISLFSKKNT